MNEPYHTFKTIHLTCIVMDFKSRYEAYRQQAEQALKTCMPAADTPPARLHQAMRHSLEAGGKRLRPVLVLATCDLAPSTLDPAPAAAAIEALHTYTLIHDDLPCMDDSDLRRGKPTCHKAFDEATALLAGDGLLTESFALLARAYRFSPETALALIDILADAASSRKLIGGQQEDTLGEMKDEEERLLFIHRNKTAALLTAAVQMGARLGQMEERYASAEAMGYHLGMAFQIIDDILDTTADTETLGKTAGLDEKNGTLTFPRLYGLDQSRHYAAEHTSKAIAAAEALGGQRADFLVELIRAMEHRIQ